MMFVPHKPRSKIQMILEKHEMNNMTRGQLIKKLIQNGWSSESAETLADSILSLFSKGERT